MPPTCPPPSSRPSLDGLPAPPRRPCLPPRLRCARALRRRPIPVGCVPRAVSRDYRPPCLCPPPCPCAPKPPFPRAQGGGPLVPCPTGTSCGACGRPGPGASLEGGGGAVWGTGSKGPRPPAVHWTSGPGRGGYNSDDLTRVGVGGGGALSQEAVMTEGRLRCGKMCQEIIALCRLASWDT